MRIRRNSLLPLFLALACALSPLAVAQQPAPLKAPETTQEKGKAAPDATTARAKGDPGRARNVREYCAYLDQAIPESLQSLKRPVRGADPAGPSVGPAAGSRAAPSEDVKASEDIKAKVSLWNSLDCAHLIYGAGAVYEPGLRAPLDGLNRYPGF
jgi:hypothetical protein